MKAVFQVSGEIADEMGQVLDFETSSEQATGPLSAPDMVTTEPPFVEVAPGADGAGEIASQHNTPIPHVEKQVVLDLEVVDEALRAEGNYEAGIPDYNADRGEAEVIDLTIHASEDLSLEAERRLKKRALHTVIDFLGGRG